MEEEGRALAVALAESLDGPIPPATIRQIPGVVRFPGKASAIVGARCPAYKWMLAVPDEG